MGSETDVMHYLIVSVMPPSMYQLVIDRLPLADGQSFGGLVSDHYAEGYGTISQVVFQLGNGVNCLNPEQLSALTEHPFVVDFEVATAAMVFNRPVRTLNG